MDKSELLLYRILTANATALSTDDGITDDVVPNDGRGGIIMSVFSAISIVSCVPAISSAIFPHLRKRVYIKVVIYLQIANLFSALGSVLGYPEMDSAACMWQGMATNYFPLVSVLWTIVVAWLLYGIVHVGKVYEIDYRTHLVCWGFPLLPTLVPFINCTYNGYVHARTHTRQTHVS